MSNIDIRELIQSRLQKVIELIENVAEKEFGMTFGETKYELLDSENLIYRIYVEIPDEFTYWDIREFFEALEKPLKLDWDDVRVHCFRDRMYVSVKVWLNDIEL